MTAIVFAVCVIITGLATLMTHGDNILRDPFTKTFIENKILSDKLIFNALSFRLACIFNDATIQLKYIF